ncbi:hypothetical protein JW992_08600 [candidate division KSB1 bacterium]|nr:hypothetical protein [candidate division KSB1 bacterium]
MEQPVQLVLDNLYELKKAHQRLIAGKTPTAQGEKDADRALGHVLKSLEDSRLDELYRRVIVPAQPRDLNAAQIAAAAVSATRLLARETAAVRDLRVRSADVRRAIAGLQKEPKRATKPVAELAELGQTLETLHQAAKVRLEKARKETRKSKKESKKQLWRGIWSAIFGVGLIVANTRLPAAAAVSYSVGLSALHQAGRDLSED